MIAELAALGAAFSFGLSSVLTRKGLFSFDPSTGGIDPGFVADFDVEPVGAFDIEATKAVEALAPAPGGGAIFVGGSFGALNGVPQRKLTRLDAATGALDPSFDFSIRSAVKDLVVIGNRLIVAGAFSEVAHQMRVGLAAIDLAASPPRLDPDVNIAFTQPRQGIVPRVETIAVTPDGNTLVAGGNFMLANGQSRPQIAVVDLGARPARVLDWHTERYNARDPNTGQMKCSAAFDTQMRDIDVAPNGSYFAVVTTGGFSRGTLCDTATRWETSARGSNLQPTWVNYDGGDSFTGVAVTGAAVYVGGHNRWLNNPFPNGTSLDGIPGPGNVPREGIAALDPVSGLPLPWNPGRERGEGAWALVSTPAGLWVGSDTDVIGGETHKKLAFLPLGADGAVLTTVTTFGIPGDLYVAGADKRLTRRYFDGRVAGDLAVADTTIDWSRVRGAFLANGNLYTGQDNGTLLVRSFNGSAFGAPQTINLRGLTSTRFPISQMTGMFYDNGRLYYTRSGDGTLYYRYFHINATVPDTIVGAETVVATTASDGLDASRVKGMILAGGRLYWGEDDGLHGVDFAGGRPMGPGALVARAASFASRGMFVGALTTTPPPPGGGGPGPVVPPAPAPPGVPPASARSGYWMVDSHGAVYTFGDAKSLGDAVPYLGGAKAVDLEPTPSFKGYWVVDETGRVFAFGDARYLGNVDRGKLARDEKVTSLSATPSGAGYWVFTSRGRVLNFGDARHLGDMSAVRLNGPVLDSISTRSGQGYYMVASDGGIFSFGDAKFYGSMGSARLNAPVQSLVPDPDGVGYWLVASDGGVFAFAAPFRGSMGSTRLNKPMTGMVPYGNGYLMVAEDGGIFSFSDKSFAGSLGSNPPAHPVVSVAALNG